MCYNHSAAVKWAEFGRRRAEGEARSVSGQRPSARLASKDCRKSLQNKRLQKRCVIMQYKVLALDLDGTLLNSKNQVSEKTKRAVWDYIDAGGTVVLASGRPTRGVWPAEDLELFQRGGYILAYNGGEIIRCETGRTVYRKDIPADLVPEIIRMVKQAGMETIAYEDGYVLLEQVKNLWFDREASVCRMEYKEVPDLAAYLTFPVVKLLGVGAPEQVLSLEKKAQKAFGSRMDIYRSEDFYLDFMSKGIDKAASLEVLLKSMGLNKDSLMVCGDGYNDISMVTYAGLGVAMGNAVPQVLKAADWVTKSNDEDGIAWALDRFVFGRQES